MVDFKVSLSPSRLLSTSLSFAAVVQSLPHYPSRPAITWSKCPGFNNTTVIDCGELQVPLAYFDTTHGSPDDIDLDKALQSHQTISIGMARLKATGPKRLGSLIFNPGGPGGAGSFFTLGEATHGVPVFGETLTAHYDIIGLDPRGTGLSARVKCDPDLWNKRVNIFASTDEKFENLVQWSTDHGEACKKLTGPLLDHLDTIHVVHDIELVRRALGDEKLNFLGLSYGSQIGSQYAEYFPQKIGRMVLDGNVDHSNPEVNMLANEGLTSELTLDYFFDWCAKSKKCALHGKDAPTLFDQLISDANKKPIPAKKCRKNGSCRPLVTGHDILLAVQGNLGQSKPTLIAPETSYPILSKQIAAAMDGDASDFSYPLATSKADDAFAEIAIGCQDWMHTARSATDIRQLLEMMQVLAPHSLGSSQSLQVQTMCLGWPAPVSNPQRLLKERAMEAPTILMINSYFDPSTSIVWANGLKKQLPNPHLVFRKGPGHTSYFLAGEASKATDHYFVTGKMPADGAMFDS